jgi:hypothetical protein
LAVREPVARDSNCHEQLLADRAVQGGQLLLHILVSPHEMARFLAQPLAPQAHERVGGIYIVDRRLGFGHRWWLSPASLAAKSPRQTSDLGHFQL